MFELNKTKEVEELIAITKSDSGISGPELAKAHIRLGELLAENIDLESADTTVVALLRGGIFFAQGIYFKLGCKFEVYDPKQGEFKRPIALGINACKLGMKVRFFTAANLANSLIEAQDNKSLMRLEKQLEKADLLIIDELSYLTFNLHQSELLFKIISDRAERQSVIVSTNLKFSDWTSMFENKTMVAALVGRLTFMSHVLNMNSDNPYRDEHAAVIDKGRKGDKKNV